MLRKVPFELVSLDDLGVPDEVEETGATFAENATLKARAYCGLGGLLTLADDSGLEVDSLDGEPGVFSSRYGGDPSISDQDRVSLLLHNLDGVPWEQRTARFRCVIAIATPLSSLLVDPPIPPLTGEGLEGVTQGDRGDLTLVAGSVAGMIQYEPLGYEGFGYDPVFYLPSYSLTMAQISLEEKNRISHRAGAAGKAAGVLQSLCLNHR